MRRLYCMERKMDGDPLFAQMYCEKIEDFVTKGYAFKMNADDAAKHSDRTDSTSLILL